MKTYEACFDATKEGVYSISLVDDPATQEMFIYMNSDKKIELKEVNKEQRILMGVVLKPDQLIYRYNEQTKEEFNIVFRAKTIKDLAHNFYKQGYQTNSKLEHDEPIDGVTIVESWIVEDSDKDKSAALGLKADKGDWVAMMKIDSDTIWNDYVKTGQVKGFSIDAFMKLEEINLNSDINMSKLEEAVKNGFDDLKSLFLSKEVVKDEAGEDKTVELGSVPSGDIVVMFDGETLEVGAAVWMEGEDAVKIPLPVGSYPIEGGMLVVSEEGVAGELNPTEAPAEEAPAPDVKAELSEGEGAAPAVGQDAINDIKSILVKFTEQTNERFNKLEEVNVALKAEVVELSAAPADKVIKSRVGISYSEMTNVEKMKHNKLN